MAKTANVTRTTSDDLLKTPAWRDADGTLMHYVKLRKDGSIVERPVTFSISASISEKFNIAIDTYLAENPNWDSDVDEDGDEPTTESTQQAANRAAFFKASIADVVNYDLSSEPVADKGSGLAGYRASVTQAFEAEKTLKAQQALLASLLTPEQLTALQAAMAEQS